jgi:hypothetical protein
MLAVPNPKLIFRRNLRLLDSLTVPSPAPDMTICADAGRLYPASRFWDQYFQAAAFTLTGIRNMYLSSLRKIIQALGGDLEVRAIFPSGPAQIKQFRELRRGRAVRRI